MRLHTSAYLRPALPQAVVCSCGARVRRWAVGIVFPVFMLVASSVYVVLLFDRTKIKGNLEVSLAVTWRC